MRAVPLTMRAKRSAISCRCELNVSIQINKGSSYRMVAYSIIQALLSVYVSLPALPGRALFASVGITSSMASTLFECIIYLAVSTARARALSFFLPPSLRSLLRCCGVCFLIIKSDSTTLSLPSLSGRQAGSQHRPPSPHPARCAPFDVLHNFFCFHFTTQLNSSWSRLELRRSGAVAAPSRL